MIVRKPRLHRPVGRYFAHERFCFERSREPIQIAAVTKFPTRTLILMGLTLLSFAWFYWNAHRRAARPDGLVIVPVVLPTADGGTP